MVLLAPLDRDRIADPGDYEVGKGGEIEGGKEGHGARLPDTTCCHPSEKACNLGRSDQPAGLTAAAATMLATCRVMCCAIRALLSRRSAPLRRDRRALMAQHITLP